jgi:hypothetical protein
MQQRQMWRSTQTRPEPGRAIVVVNEDGTLARIAQFVRDDEGEWVVNDVDDLHCELFGDYAYWTYFDFPEDQPECTFQSTKEANHAYRKLQPARRPFEALSRPG